MIQTVYEYIGIYLVILIVTTVALRCAKDTRKLRRNTWLALIAITLLIIGDAICDFTHFVMPPIAYPFDANGEQLTIFSMLLTIPELYLLYPITLVIIERFIKHDV